MKTARSAFCLAVCAALLGACTPEAPADAPARVKPSMRVVLVGDSITAGLVSEPKGLPYARLLAKRLGDDFEVRNVGCSGTSTPDWTRTEPWRLCRGELKQPSIYEAEVVPLLPAAFVSVLLGTNDARGRRTSNAREYGDNLREIATNLLEDGAERVVLLGPPILLHSTRTILRSVAFGEERQAICDEHPRVVCGPDLRFLVLPEDFEEGNVHPNGRGHAKIAEALAEFLLALAQEPVSDATAANNAEGSGQTQSAPADSSSARLP